MNSSRLLLVGVASSVTLILAALMLYGVIGPRPTISGPLVVPPSDVLGVLEPRADGGPLRVLLVGTSLTARGNWPQRLEQELAKCSPEGIQVERLAKSGAGIRWGLPQLQIRLADVVYPRPDIIVAEFGGNDASPRQGLPLFLSRARTRLLIETVRTAGAIPFLSTMNPGWGGEAITRPGQARYHGMYRDIAAETGVGLIDTVQLWLALPETERRRLVPDDGHPTDEGMQRITIPAFLAALRPLVCG